MKTNRYGQVMLLGAFVLMLLTFVSIAIKSINLASDGCDKFGMFVVNDKVYRCYRMDIKTNKGA